MSSHTAHKNRVIGDTYPIRVKVKIAARGVGNLIGEIHSWIRDNMAPNRCKYLPFRANHQQATASHFCNLNDAQAFLEAFPMLQLAGGLEPTR